MEYFKVLKHISPTEGQILDYVYAHRPDEWPVLYLRDRARPPFSTYEEYLKKVDREAENNLPTLLKLDGTPASFFELVLFKCLTGPWYPVGRAAFNDTRLITVRNEVDEIIEHAKVISEEDRKRGQEQMRNTDISPSVKFVDQDIVSVSVVLFCEWVGFERITVKISSNYPHVFLATDTQVLSDCGAIILPSPA